MRIEAGHARRSAIEVDLTRRQSELQFLDETSRKELNLAVAELETPPDTSLEVLQAAEQSYQETRTKIENLGAVNPTAYEEHQEAQLRMDFLTAQRQDLLDSIRDTEKAIQEIDEFSKNKFSEAFKAINENFKLAFQQVALYRPPDWPDGSPQQSHLDFTVSDLRATSLHAVSLGASVLSERTG